MLREKTFEGVYLIKYFTVLADYDSDSILIYPRAVLGWFIHFVHKSPAVISLKYKIIEIYKKNYLP